MTSQDWNDSFAGRLTWLRYERRLTQEQLARRSGLSIRSISSLECGTRHPRRETVERLAIGLGLTLSQHRQLAGVTTTLHGPTVGPRWDDSNEAGMHQQPVDATMVFPPRGLPLIGREDAVAELGAHIRGSGPSLILYVGEPGIGKTRLLAEADSLAADAATPVLTGICRRGSEPYSPIVDALAPYVRQLPRPTLLAILRDEPGMSALLPELARLLPHAPALPAAEHRRRLVFAAALRLLEQAARNTGRVVLLLDDLQWAQSAAGDLLCSLVDRMGIRLRIVATVRAGELSARSGVAPCIADLARLGRVVQRSLQPLTQADALRLAGREDVAQLAGGLPLFLVELAAAAGDGVPEHLRIAVLQQLADLPDDTRSLLLRIAAGPAVTTVEQLVQGGDARRVLKALEPAIWRHLLDDTGLGFQFRYPLLRQILLSDVGPTRRQLLRRALVILGGGRHLSRPAIS